MKSLIIFVAAALFEITGCFAFWMVVRQHKSVWWLGLGIGSLLVFASLLTQPNVELAGRTYAAYGGIYIVCSLGWLVLVEKGLPDRWDLIGAFFCVLGAFITLFGPRGAR